METQLVIFLAFTSVTVVTNTLLIVFAYRAFANVTTKVTEAVREFETSYTTKSWIGSLVSASESALELSDVAKDKVQAFDPVLERTQDRYGYLLAKTDKKLQDFSDELTKNSERLRDSVETPARHMATFAAGLRAVFGTRQNGEDEN